MPYQETIDKQTTALSEIPFEPGEDLIFVAQSRERVGLMLKRVILVHYGCRQLTRTDPRNSPDWILARDGRSDRAGAALCFIEPRTRVVAYPNDPHNLALNYFARNCRATVPASLSDGATASEMVFTYAP